MEVNSGAVLVVHNLTVAGGHAEYPGQGGGIYNDGTLSVTDSTFSGNSAVSYGGALENDGTGVVSNSTFSGNRAGLGGGGIDNNRTVTVRNSTFSGNSAASGGGIDDYGTLEVTNSTFSGNSASYYGGGGIRSNVGISAEGVLNYSNTIIANSSAGGDCLINGGSIGTNTNNLVEDNTCSPALHGDPLLGGLRDNGGPTQTMALLSGSPAIDAALLANCAATDQRGVSRPQAAGCDIGSFESTGGEPTTIMITADAPDPSVVDQSVALVQAWVDAASSNYGIYLYPPAGSGAASFSSREGTDPPVLNVTYSP